MVMATESPLRMHSHKEAVVFVPSTPGMSGENLGLLRNSQRFHDIGRDAVPNRSGSAPPSMEGSFLAISNIISQANFNQDSCDGGLQDVIRSFDTGKQLSLTFHGSNANSNVRLPTPPILRENRHVGHHTGIFGRNWGLAPVGESDKNSLNVSQPILSTHREETEDECSPQQPCGDVVGRANGFWSGEHVASSAGQSRVLVDLIREDFPHTPLPLYNHSHSLSSGATEEVTDHNGDYSFHDPVSPSNTVASTRVTERVSPSLNTDDSTTSVSSSLSVHCTGTIKLNPSPHKEFSSCANVSFVESKMKDLNVSGFPNSKEQRNQEQWHHSYHNSMPHPQMYQQRGNSFQVQSDKSQVGSQGVNSSYLSTDPSLHGLPKFSAEVQPLLQSSGFTPPLYASAAAYMASPSTFYPSVQASSFYSPHYGLGAYTLNSTVIPPFVAGYPPQGAVQMAVDGPVSPNIGSRVSGASAGGVSTHGADLQHYNKFYGQLGYAVQPSFADPMYMQYYQQPYGPSYSISGQLDPLALGTSVFGNQNNTPDPKKGSEAGSGLDDPKSQHQRSIMNIMNQTRWGITNPHYAGNPPNMGIMMPFPSSVPNPVLPGSSAGGTGISGGRNEVRFSPGSGRYPPVYSGWQGPRSEAFSDPNVYNFLEELKSGKGRRFELSDISGHIVEFSADQHGSRFIQQKLENCSAEEKASVFKEVLPYSSKLMTDVFGNYVIQKFFEYGSPEQRKELGNQLTGQILPLSLQMYGCRVIQKALEAIELEQKAQLIRELDGHVMRCVHDQNGNHVIQKCIESVPANKIEFIISAFCGQVAALSTHPYGCRVIQRVLEHCADELHCQFIVDEILESVYDLAQDQYGNYVTQHVLERGKPHERCEIVSKLLGHIIQLSQHKFASNVIEKCLEYSSAAEREQIIQEILGHKEGNDNLLTMVKDQYANYVVQKILDTCNDAQRAMLLNRIRMHVHALKKYTYGKHIVARFEQQFGEDAP
ncbi:hypothetical protein K2173_016039 [Erythroxylum novogranatense]|uniref:PUM-HD domain-containing protein n=1 Tax=Erythroxylum novogranatense TaxID=1862640 RepID=A0AAV8SFT0_9ROSI|nr:hypothetical protein K2173_016039 [Erythroxylum novogranatense]